MKLGPTNYNLPFTAKNQEVVDYNIHIDGINLEFDQLTAIKINPYRTYSVELKDGNPYYLFEITTMNMVFPNPPINFVQREADTFLAERYNKLVVLPGAIAYPSTSRFRLDGWLCKEFNGSPEFGIAHTPVLTPRAGELLHHHTALTEVYIGLSGRSELFVENGEGVERLDYTNRDGKKTQMSGEVVQINQGDVFSAGIGPAHRMVYRELPVTYLCLNYAIDPLHLVPKDERVVLEQK